jgi:uncharacterized repeat protein (TIGR03843 family)
MVIEDSNLAELREGELEVIGRLVDASNASLLCLLPSGKQVVYKPIAGERPLWDFPDGNLASREVAAFYIDQVAGFGIVPRTVMRDGPFGPGAVQEWIDIDPEIDVVSMASSDNTEIRIMSLLDCILNNTDRKFGHILIKSIDELYGCDHGVTLHSEPKLRTVLWQFAGQALTDSEIEALSKLPKFMDLPYLQTLITSEEITALLLRIDLLLESGCFPDPNPNWPPVPWPPY